MNPDDHSLTAEEQRLYERDGFLIRASVFSAEEIKTLRAAAEDACRKAVAMCSDGKTYILDGKRFVDVGHTTIQFEHAADSNTARVIEPIHELNSQLDQLIDDARIVAPMQSILGMQMLALWTAKLNLKRPREGSGFGWHQDSPYWIHDCDHVDQLPNVMVSFDQATADNGCLRVIRGSHKDGCLPGTDDGSQLGGFFTDPKYCLQEEQVAMEVPQGSLIFFNPHTIHGSLPNESEHPRRAIIFTYQPAGFPQLKSGEVRNITTGK
ncbi:MAG: phytanoyl-CoA dioxygenase family protein [Pseudomonadales bacterium]|nr:phytanoyl-CoA dioxygenase family protein [Pseudomonadales bacterium]MDG1443342.1 phytanoyl-CoA dioxygenase family protein [Pseudomonadales bacterium]